MGTADATVATPAEAKVTLVTLCPYNPLPPRACGAFSGGISNKGSQGSLLLPRGWPGTYRYGPSYP